MTLSCFATPPCPPDMWWQHPYSIMTEPGTSGSDCVCSEVWGPGKGCGLNSLDCTKNDPYDRNFGYVNCKPGAYWRLSTKPHCPEYDVSWDTGCHLD